MRAKDLFEKSTSQAQFRTMAAAANNPKFAKKVGISQDVAREFHAADRKSDYKKLPDHANESQLNELFDADQQYFKLADGQVIRADFTQAGLNPDGMSSSIKISTVDPKIMPSAATTAVQPWDKARPNIRAAIQKWVQGGQQTVSEIKKGQKDSNGYTKCWPGKHAEGTKKSAVTGKQVRNCVPNEGVEEAANPAQQAAIAIAMKKAGQKPKSQGVAEGKMAELDMDLEDPEISDRQFEKMYGMTRKEARELFSKTNMWDFPQVRDPNKPLHEQGVAEAGSFSYGSKAPRKGSVADLAAKKRKEQQKGKQPVEPKDQMVGVAKVITKGVWEGLKEKEYIVIASMGEDDLELEFRAKTPEGALMQAKKWQKQNHIRQVYFTVKEKGVAEGYKPSAGELARDLIKLADDDFNKKYGMSKQQANQYYSSSKLKEQGVAEGSNDWSSPLYDPALQGNGKKQRYEMMFKNGQVKRFSAMNDNEARKIAAGHGAKSVIRMKGNVPSDKIKEQGVAEGSESLEAWETRMKKLGYKITKDNKTGTYHAWQGTTHKGSHRTQGVAEGKMAELDMDLEDPEISDRQFEKMYGMTRKEARELFSKTNMWDFPQVRDPNKPLHEQGVAEGAPELLKKEMPLHRHAEKLLAQNGVSKDDPDYHHHLGNTIKHLRQFGNIDLINKSDEQGVAEARGKDQDQFGGMHQDDFQEKLMRLKKLAQAGPMKTVYDPNKRVYKNMPTAVQPPRLPKK